MAAGIPSELGLLPETKIGDSSDQILQNARDASYKALHDMQNQTSPKPSAPATPARSAPPAQGALPEQSAESAPDQTSATQGASPDANRPYNPDTDAVDVLQRPSEDQPTKVDITTPKEAGTFQSFWSTLANKVSIGATEGVKGLERVAAGVVARGLDATGNQKAVEFGDSLFKTIDDAWAPGLKYTQGVQAANEARGTVGTGSKVVGQVAGGAASLAAGPEAFLLSSAGQTGMDSIASNQDVKTAWMLATAAGAANAVGMKIPMGSPTLIRRLAWGAGGNVAVSAASEWLAKQILKSGGYKEAADGIHPLDPTSMASSGLMGLIFGLLGKPDIQKKFSDLGGTVPPELNPAPPPNTVDVKPVVPETQKAPATPAPAAPRSPPVAPPAKPVLDVPSAESSKDLAAQLQDAANPKTPRTGVLVSKPSLDALASDKTADGTAVRSVVKSAQKSGRLVKTPNGDFLVMPTVDAAVKAKAELASGSDPQAVIGRITGAGGGKSADQTVVVQGHTPEGAVVKESAVAPAEIPAKVAEVVAEKKIPVVTTHEAVQARRAETVAEAQKPEAGTVKPKMGIAEVGKKEMPVHIEEGAPEGMTRVRPIGEDGEPAAMTHDIPSGKVRTASEVPAKPAAPKPEVSSEPPAAEKVSEAAKEAPAEEESAPLAKALQQHESSEKTTTGERKRPKLGERQQNTATFARALEAAAKENAGKADEATVARALKAAKSGARMDEKGELATRKGRGTGHARLDAINEEMHKTARLLMGKGEAGDEIPAAAPKAAALKARVEKVKAAKETPKAEPKSTSPAKQAEAEVRAKFPGVEHLEEHALAARMLKKRTAEIEAEQAAAKKKAQSEMVEAPIYKEVEKTVTDEQLRKARNEATVDANQAKMSGHPTHAEKAAKSAEVYAALKRQHDIEHGVALEPDEPKTKSEQLKAKNAADEQTSLQDDYQNATDEEAPALFEKVVAGAEKLAGRALTEKEKGDAYRAMEAMREARKSTNEAADEASLDHRMHFTTAEALKSKNPLVRAMGQLNKNLTDAGIYRKLQDVRASGATIGAHEVLRDMIKHAPNPGMRAMFTRLLQVAPNVAVRPTGSVVRGRTGEVNTAWGGAYNSDMAYIQSKIENRPFTPETMIHEMAHAASVHELNTNPHGELATELEGLLDTVRRRMAKKFGEEVIARHMHYFENGGKQGPGFDRDFYGLASPKEFISEYYANPEFFSRLAALDEGLPEGTPPIGVLGKVARIIARFITGGKHGTPLVEQAGDLIERIMLKQQSNPKFRELYMRTPEEHAAKLPYAVQEHQVKDALEATMEAMDGPDKEAFGNIEQQISEPAPKLPRGDTELGNIISDEGMEKIRSFSNLAREGTFRAVRNAKMAFTAADQLMRRFREDFGHKDDPKNPLVELESATDGRHAIRHEMEDRAKPIAEARLRLPKDVDKKLGQLQIDATMWGIDPSKPKDEHPIEISGQKGFDARYEEFKKRWANTPDAAKQVFKAERDYLQWSGKKAHRAGVDTALAAYDMRDITPAQRALLYSVKDPSEYDSLVGPGNIIDIGESNEPVKAALKSMAGLTRLSGYYAPLARHGDYVTQVQPEGTKSFATQAEAEAFANKVKALSPGSRAKAEQIAGKWQVPYKAEYTSFHRTPADAEADAAKMRALGFDVGLVTKKIYGEDNVPMTSGMKELVAEATRQINKGGESKGSEALVENLRSAFLRMMANRSAYSASRLARKSVAGVKGEEMGRNFAQHVQSTAYHTSSLMTVFKEAEALGNVRAAARDQHAQVNQATMYRRGALVEEIGKRMAQEARQYGSKVPGNALMAKLGYANYLFSPAHTAINLTQNFTTAIPLATARFGPRSMLAFARSMKMIAGPAFKTTFLAHIKPGQLTGRDVLNAVIEAIRRDPVHGKWARGENSPLQQLVDKGVITSTFSNELADIAKGENPFWGRVFEYARLLPHLSDVFNRTTTALAGLELTKGNVQATADLVQSTHVNYSAENMPRAFRGLKQIPVFGTSMVMFKTYMQGMAHLLYSTVRDSVMGGRHVEGSFVARRAEAAKTVAALVLGTALFTGLKGATPELVHLGAYAYNKLFGDKDEYWSFENSMHRALAELLGNKAGELAFAGLPHAAGIDVANRMGFNELFLHNPPDILNADSDTFNKFVVDELGTVPGLAINNILDGYHKISNGDVAGGLEAAVPIKLFQSVMSAYHEYTSGNTHGDGNMMVEPGNAYGAAMQAFGFKPASLANAQEKQGTEIEYRDFINNRKKAIISDLVNNGMDMQKVGEWNAKHPNPGDRISAQDVLKMRRQRMMAEQQAKGAPNRNSEVRELTDY